MIMLGRVNNRRQLLSDICRSLLERIRLNRGLVGREVIIGINVEDVRLKDNMSNL